MTTASREQAYPEALSSREDRLVAQRRDRVDSVVGPDGTTGRVPAGGHSSAPADGARLRDDRPRVGLALSGGGIRSATFSLGVLQALARERLIGRIDFLSTVSGGGYVGAFLGCLFQRWRALHAAGPAAGEETDTGRGRPRAARQPARVALPLAPRVRPLPDPQPGQRRSGDARRVPAQLGRRAGRAGRAAAGAAHPLPSRRRTPRTHRLSPSRGRARGRSRGTVARSRRRRLLARRSVRAAAGRRRRGGGSPRVSDARRSGRGAPPRRGARRARRVARSHPRRRRVLPAALPRPCRPAPLPHRGARHGAAGDGARPRPRRRGRPRGLRARVAGQPPGDVHRPGPVRRGGGDGGVRAEDRAAPSRRGDEGTAADPRPGRRVRGRARDRRARGRAPRGAAAPPGATRPRRGSRRRDRRFRPPRPHAELPQPLDALDALRRPAHARLPGSHERDTPALSQAAERPGRGRRPRVPRLCPVDRGRPAPRRQRDAQRDDVGRDPGRVPRPKGAQRRVRPVRAQRRGPAPRPVRGGRARGRRPTARAPAGPRARARLAARAVPGVRPRPCQRGAVPARPARRRVRCRVHDRPRLAHEPRPEPPPRARERAPRLLVGQRHRPA